MKALSVLLLATFFFVSYQLKSQCDPDWANIELGKTGTTICQNTQLGSLLVLLTVYTDGNNDVCDRFCTPADLNSYLNRNNGWEGTTGIRWKALEKIGIFLLECTTDLKKIKTWYDQKRTGFDVFVNIFGGKLWGRVDSVNPQYVGVKHSLSKDLIIKTSWSQIVKACHIEDGSRTGRNY
eukprot:TRINITY_DN413_c0_g2_i3.p1 TRINITY_DN413_c0_g2~~TRINITY_DN413_c0_g2_i3.p1  ORF type:complete len:180 (-),score=26.00 TRINITY_DN413_c0_g2_i3:127-666(-)